VLHWLLAASLPLTYTVHLAEALGDLGIDEVFERLSTEPVAAASLGQVYKGTLRSTGAAVAVKCLRPGVEPQVSERSHLQRAGGTPPHSDDKGVNR
jgi:predicted unusual protein kinase regulating ubiquinone biosynthesis (AarF/ABC1/UbiB family)